MPIKGFENYKINKNGTITNSRGHVLKHNNAGLAPHHHQIALRKDGKTYQKQVHVLVAEHFL